MLRILIAVTALLSVAAGCGGEPEAQPTASSTPTVAEPTPTPPPTPTPTPEPVWPLTGLPAPDGPAERPALVVKVDNTASARPQVGLSAADIVVEELVEGGLTRLAVMYHSSLPDAVTPVRSIRTSDIGIVLPTGGALVASGGAQRVLRAMDEAGVTVVTEGSAGFTRAGGRPSLYSVTVDLEDLLTEVDGLEPPDAPYLPWAGPDDEVPAGEPAASVTARFSGGRSSAWDWTDGAWHRQDDLAAEGDEFVADTLLVLRVAIRDAGYTDPAGNFVPETVLEGSGDAVLFAAGSAVEGTWSKPRAEEPFELAGEDGRSLAVPAGRTWIGLVPQDGDVSWTSS
ncbi:MAG TPA: DUF3048 domain-containing protein [Jiangellaceae bacterium]